jgi:hypothetical protein
MLEAGLKHLYDAIHSNLDSRDLPTLGVVMQDLKSIGTLKNDLEALALKHLGKYAASEGDSQQLVIAGSSQDPNQGDGAYDDELAVVKGII